MKLSTLAKIFVLALVLTACGGDDPSDIAAVVSLSTTADQVAEGDMVTLTVTSDRIVSSNISVPVIYRGTATNGSDYQSSTRVIITEGTNSANLGILIQTDEIQEGDETIIVEFSDLGLPNGVSLSDQTSVTITIAGEI
ncbi:MAG: Calx-beta domain-containing protein [Cytophagales bacterium]|nr:Calx-beta domain-containing protein [Cytophagales bacterium]